jgi:hypothetical protein
LPRARAWARAASISAISGAEKAWIQALDCAISGPRQLACVSTGCIAQS